MASEALITIDAIGRVSGATAADAEVLSSLAGGTYRAVLTTPAGRSLSQLKMWWAMCTLIADNYGEDITKQDVSDVLLIECGHRTSWKQADGTFRRSPKSIAFNNLSGEAFGKLVDQAFDHTARIFGAGLTRAVRGELARMAAGEPKVALRRAA